MDDNFAIYKEKISFDEIFAIYKTSGYMDDFHQYVYAVTFDEEKAKKYVEKYNIKLRKIKDEILKMFSDDEYGFRNEGLYEYPKNHHWYSNILNQNDCYYTKVKMFK